MVDIVRSLPRSEEVQMVVPDDLLPPIGREIPCRCRAANVPLRVDVLGTFTLDFAGGIKVRVESDLGAGLSGVKLKLIGHEVSAESPVLGRVTIRQADVDVTPLGLLELIGYLPPTFRQILFLDFYLTVEKPPGGGPPLVLANVRTAALISGDLGEFPPQSSVYRLHRPVDLAPVGAPGCVVAQLLEFPVTVSFGA